MPTRRTVISSVAVLLAGCSILQQSPGRTVLDADIELAAGEYRTVEFELQEQREVEFGISGIENAKVDILFMSPEQFEAYREGSKFEPRYSSGLGVSGGWAEETVPAGEYVVVFDNTERGAATPSGNAVSGHARVEILPAD
jgi:hypothetical protein